jgi:hypothetical protein
MKLQAHPAPTHQSVMQEPHAALADWTLQKQRPIENTIPKQRTVVMEAAAAMRPADGL